MNMKTTSDSDSNESSHTDDDLSVSNGEQDTIATVASTSINTAVTIADKTTDNLPSTQGKQTPPAAEILQQLETLFDNKEVLDQWRHIYTQRQLSIQARYDAIHELPIETRKRIAEQENQIKTNARKVTYKLLYVTQGNLQDYADGTAGVYSRIQQRKLSALTREQLRVSQTNRRLHESISALLPRQTVTETRIFQENSHYLNEHASLKSLLTALEQLQQRLPPTSHAKQLLDKLFVEPPVLWLSSPSPQQSFDDLLQTLISELKKPVLSVQISLNFPRKVAEAFKDIGPSFRYGILDRSPITPAAGPVPRQRRHPATSITTRPATATVPLYKQIQEQSKHVIKQANKLADKVDTLTDKVLPKDPPIVIIGMWTWKYIIKPVVNYLTRQATPAINQLRQALGMEPLQVAARERTQADATDRTYRIFMQMADQLIKSQPSVEHLITQHPQPTTLTQEQRNFVENYLKLSRKLWSTLVANPELQKKITDIPTARQTLATVKVMTDQLNHYYRSSPSPAPAPDLENEPVRPSPSITPGKH